MPKPKISVIIPFYNRVDWLLEAIDSVLEQSFIDFEIILIDDGSTENVSRILQYKDPRIHYFHQENKGRSIARNNGLQHAQGKYIAFLDADDLFSKNKLEVQFQYMEQHPDIILTYTSYQRIDEKSTYISTQYSGSKSYNHYSDLMLSCLIATPTVMVNRAFLISHNIQFPIEVHIGEDSLFWIAVAKAGLIKGIDKILSSVRISSTSTTNDLLALIQGKKTIMEKALIPDQDMSPLKKCFIKSIFYQKMFIIYFANSDLPNAIQYLLRAIYSCPLRIPIIFATVITLGTKSILKQYKKRKRNQLQKI